MSIVNVDDFEFRVSDTADSIGATHDHLPQRVLARLPTPRLAQNPMLGRERPTHLRCFCASVVLVVDEPHQGPLRSPSLASRVRSHDEKRCTCPCVASAALSRAYPPADRAILSNGRAGPVDELRGRRTHGRSTASSRRWAVIESVQERSPSSTRSCCNVPIAISRSSVAHRDVAYVFAPARIHCTGKVALQRFEYDERIVRS